MPGFDRTGPQGAGPMTGGARGYCNPGFRRNTFAYGRGYGMGRGFRAGFGGGPGFGRGYGRGFGARGAYPPAGGWYGSFSPYETPYTMSSEDELKALKNDLESINKRIQEIESQS